MNGVFYKKEKELSGESYTRVGNQINQANMSIYLQCVVLPDEFGLRGITFVFARIFECVLEIPHPVDGNVDIDVNVSEKMDLGT